MAILTSHSIGRWVALAVAATLWFGGAGSAAADSPSAEEYKLKAVFLYKVLQFVEWPTNAFSRADAPLKVVVVGVDPFGDVLDDVFRNERIHQHPVIVERVRSALDLQDAHVVFISQSERERVPRLLARTRSLPLLTISDMDGFTRLGGMLGMPVRELRVRPEVNLAAVNASGLTMSSKLLRLSKVSPGGP